MSESGSLPAVSTIQEASSSYLVGEKESKIPLISTDAGDDQTSRENLPRSKLKNGVESPVRSSDPIRRTTTSRIPKPDREPVPKLINESSDPDTNSTEIKPDNDSQHAQVDKKQSFPISTVSVPPRPDLSANSAGSCTGGVTASRNQNPAQSQEHEQPPVGSLSAALPPIPPTPPPSTKIETQQVDQIQQTISSSQSTTTTPSKANDQSSKKNQQKEANIPLAPRLNNAFAHGRDQATAESHRPVFVALPVQETESGVVTEQPQNIAPAEGLQHQQQQQPTEPTIYYQIPSVVTCVGPSQENQQQEQLPYSSVLQQPNLPQQSVKEVVQNPPEQVIGMVGAIPIVKLQTGSLHLVKEKKGRFKLLGDAPTMTTGALVGGTPVVGVVSSSGAAGQQQLASNTFMPSNVSVPTQGQSMTSTVSQPSTTVSGPQTFDGTSAPTVKKKGRFVVTNVKDPGSIPLTLQNSQSQDQQLNQWDIAQQNNPNIPATQQHQVRQRENTQILHQNPGQQKNVATQLLLSSTTETSRGYTQIGPPPSSHPAGSGTVDAYQNQPYTHHQANLYKQNTRHHNSSSENVHHHQMPPPPPVTNQVVLGDNLSQTHNAQVVDSNRQYSAGQYLTPPQTPSTTGTSAPNSPRQRAQSTIPAMAPATKAVSNMERPRSIEARKKSIQGGAGKLPQTIDKNGNWSAVGLGKVFYLLDQMKTEVTGADRTIKTLQTDMKLLRDKNKELESKVRELEMRVKEEKTLREKAETRNIELRKRIRDNAKGEVSSIKTVDQHMEDGKVGRSKEPHVEKQSIGDVGNDNVINGTNSSKRNPNSLQGNSQTSTAGGASVSSISENGGATVPSKTTSLSAKPAAPTLPAKPPAISQNRSTTISSTSGGDSQMKHAKNPVAAGKHIRSHSYNSESKSTIPNRKAGGDSVQASPAKGLSTPNTWSNENPGTALSRPPPVHPTPGANGSSAPKQQSVSDFDPLKPNVVASGPSSLQRDMVPVISLSTPVSLEAVSLNSAAPAFFHGSNDPAYTNAGANFAAQLSTGPFLSENQYVFPITLGMAPATAVGSGVNGDIYRPSTNPHGFHEQPIMVLPQQPMFQQYGGMHPVPNLSVGSSAGNTMQMQHQNNYPGQTHDNQRQSQQSPSHGSGPNPFDAFASSTDPFDDIVPRRLPPNS